MSGRSEGAVAWGALGCAGLAWLLYQILVLRAFQESWVYEGWGFLAHLGFAILGLALAAFGMRARPILCGIAAIVNGYFVLTQLVL